MTASQEFEDSLIDWTAPAIENSLTKPLIPVPVFTSPQNSIDIDNPFDALERQINDSDEVLDLLNVSSLFGSGHNSPERTSESTGILVQISDNEGLNCLTSKSESLSCTNVLDGSKYFSLSSPMEITPSSDIIDYMSLSKSPDLREMINNRISSCINQALNASLSSVSTQFSSMSNSRLDEGFFLSSHVSGDDGRPERSRSMELTWSLSDVDEDIKSIVMPTWNDEVSSSDEECNSHRLSQSLPIRNKKSPTENISGQLFRITTNSAKKPLLSLGARERIVPKNPKLLNAVLPIVNLKNKRALSVLKPLVSENQQYKINSTLSNKKEKTKLTTLLNKQKWHTPVASSTPHGRKNIVDSKYARITPFMGSPSVREEDDSRAPSPDSTSNVSVRSSRREVKLSMKDRVTKRGTINKTSICSSRVSSSQTRAATKTNTNVRLNMRKSTSFKV